MKNRSWSCLLNKPQKDNHNFHSSFFFIFFFIYERTTIFANFSNNCLVPAFWKSTVAFAEGPSPERSMTTPTPKRLCSILSPIESVGMFAGALEVTELRKAHPLCYFHEACCYDSFPPTKPHAPYVGCLHALPVHVQRQG